MRDGNGRSAVRVSQKTVDEAMGNVWNPPVDQIPGVTVRRLV